MNLIKICVWTCDMTSRSYFDKMNSTLGSVVPLAMFHLWYDRLWSRWLTSKSFFIFSTFVKTFRSCEFEVDDTKDGEKNLEEESMEVAYIMCRNVFQWGHGCDQLSWCWVPLSVWKHKSVWQVEHKTLGLAINRDYLSTVFTSDHPCPEYIVYSQYTGGRWRNQHQKQKMARPINREGTYFML